MSKQMDKYTVEEALMTFYAMPTPAPNFIAQLEAQLLVQDSPNQVDSLGWMDKMRNGWKRPFPQRRWAVAVLVLLLVTAIGLAIVGPRRALAHIQQWLGYVPGIGFVDLENTRLLAHPMSQTRDGITLTVAEVVAGPEETRIVIYTAGLPPEDELGIEIDNFEASVRLPDGTILPADTWEIRWGRGTLQFPPLPEGIYDVTLLMTHLPLVPSGVAPEAWTMPLVLRPATGELVAELFPQPYTPPNAEDSQHGIMLRVLEVAHTPQKTVINVQTQWQDTTWESAQPDFGFLPALRDNNGHVYDQYWELNNSTVSSVAIAIPEGASAPQPQTSQQTFEFAAVSQLADSLEFEIGHVEVRMPASGSFTLDLGDDPQPGDSWEMDTYLDVVGFPVHITRAELVTEMMEWRNGQETRINLNFYLESIEEQEGRSLRFISLDGSQAGFRGSGSQGARLIRVSLPDDQPIPSGVVEIKVAEAFVLFHGPWQLKWDVPDDEGIRVDPIQLRPDIVQTINDVALRLDEVTLTDRVTAVAITLDNQPEGVAIQGIMQRMPGQNQRSLYLEDGRFIRYEPAEFNQVRWRPDDAQVFGFPPPQQTQTINFPALPPLVQAATLHIPAVQMAIPGIAEFEVDIPDNLTFTAGEHGMQSSQTWMVDIRAWRVTICALQRGEYGVLIAVGH